MPPSGPGTAQIVADFMHGFSVETTPKSAAKLDDFRMELREGTWVYVTSLPDSNFDETIAACKKLRLQGMEPVPHLTSRSIPTKAVLEDRLEKLEAEAGVSRVLAIAGADKVARGEFTDTMTMIETGLFDKHSIKSIAIAGHPEGSPDIEFDQLREHGLRKLNYSHATDANMYIVTQFVFDAQPVIEWEKYIRELGNVLPIYIGLPGLATLKSLIRHAQHCGIGASMTVLTKQAKNLSKLLSLQAPDKLLLDLVKHVHVSPETNIKGVHMYPLGGLSKTAAWSYAVTDRKINVLPGDTGFEVNVNSK